MLQGAAPLSIIGRTEDTQWVLIRLEDGNTGWLLADDVFVDWDLAALPVVGDAADVGQAPLPAAFAPSGVVQSGIGSLRLRRAPGTAGDVIANLRAGTPLSLQMRTIEGDWLQVSTSDGQTGWVDANYVTTDADINGLPVSNVTVTNRPTPVPPPGFVFNGEVIAEGDGLRLRAEPSLIGPVEDNLDAFTQLQLIGRTSDSQWLQVISVTGQRGWVSAGYIRPMIDINSLPVTGETIVVELPREYPVISGITSNSRRIFQIGQQLGNRPNVFSKVGDSITVSGYMFLPIGVGRHNLGNYIHLQPVIDYFSSAIARTDNSFANSSLAADNGWTTRDVLSPEKHLSGECAPEETPLECEYRIVKPAVALIMLGTNDVGWVPADEYRQNMRRIIEISIEHGVIPVVSTIPPRPGYEALVDENNGIIIALARTYDIPLWDYYSAMKTLPNQGLSADNVHPSWPEGSPDLAANFNEEFLNYGYNVRNLTLLEVLDAVWRQVIAPSAQ